MTLDDRDIREHLERRATAGVVDPAHIAVAVVDQSARVRRLPWWRSRSARNPAVGLAAAVVIAVLGVAILPGRLGPGPGGSPSPSHPIVAGYPGDRALTTDELFAAVFDEPRAQVGTLLIADVSVIALPISCPSGEPNCEYHELRSPSRSLPIHVIGHDLTSGRAISAFWVSPGRELEFVSTISRGPGGLTWTTSELGDRIADLRSIAAASPTSYLVSGWLWSVGDYRRCLIEGNPPPSRPDFGYPCGQTRVFLAPDNTEPPVPSWAAVADSWLRLPNSVADRYASVDGPIQGFWLIDFSPGDPECTGCSKMGGATLVGRVLALGGPAPSESATPAPPTPSDTYPDGRALTAAELAAYIDDTWLAQVGPLVIADVALAPLGCAPTTLCSRHEQPRGHDGFAAAPGLG